VYGLLVSEERNKEANSLTEMFLKKISNNIEGMTNMR
jgi:hypothetical protein